MTISPMSLRKSLRSTKFKVVRFYPASFEKDKSLKELIVKTFWNISRMYQNSWWRLGQICLVHIISLGYVTRKMPPQNWRKILFLNFHFWPFTDWWVLHVCQLLLPPLWDNLLHFTATCSLEHTLENRNRQNCSSSIIRRTMWDFRTLSSPWLKYLQKSRLV